MAVFLTALAVIIGIYAVLQVPALVADSIHNFWHLWAPAAILCWIVIIYSLILEL